MEGISWVRANLCPVRYCLNDQLPTAGAVTAVHRSPPDSFHVAGATLDTAGRSALREASHSVNLTMEDPALIAAIQPDMLTSHHHERIRRRYSPRHRRRLCLR